MVSYQPSAVLRAEGRGRRADGKSDSLLPSAFSHQPFSAPRTEGRGRRVNRISFCHLPSAISLHLFSVGYKIGQHPKYGQAFFFKLIIF
jgi:hypothetical protein